MNRLDQPGRHHGAERDQGDRRDDGDPAAIERQPRHAPQGHAEIGEDEDRDHDPGHGARRITRTMSRHMVGMRFVGTGRILKLHPPPRNASCATASGVSKSLVATPRLR